MSAISREQFIEEYCVESGISWDELSQWRVAVPCDCGEDVCKGWAMVPRPAVEDHVGDPSP